MTDEIPTILAKYIAAEILKQPDRIIKSDEPLLSSGLVDLSTLWISPCLSRRILVYVLTMRSSMPPPSTT